MIKVQHYLMTFEHVDACCIFIKLGSVLDKLLLKQSVGIMMVCNEMRESKRNWVVLFAKSTLFAL